MNALRSFVVAFTVFVVVLVANKLDKFYAVSGAILGMTNVLLLPSICHLKVATKTNAIRVFNWFLIVLAAFLIVFLPGIIISQW